MLDKEQFKFGKVVFEHCFRKVCSKKLKGFSFTKTLFYAWLVARGEMCVLNINVSVCL